MIVSQITASFSCNKEAVWDIVTNNSDFSWRSDLSNLIITDELHFTEYAKNNFPTHFTITAKVPFERYEFDIENDNLKGHWIGIFRETSQGQAEIDFTEQMEVKPFLMKLLAKGFLKNQQKTYIQDLTHKLKR